jgi:uncharacterized protein (TIGR02996 family)
VTDEDALLRAVIADPEDDAPRLIYADWLDERGQCERAEFIRLQIALTEMPTDDERRPKLRRRAQRLLERCGMTWTEPLRPAVHQYHFSRGFVEIVTCEASRFLRFGQDLFSLTPIRYLFLRDADDCTLQLSQCPHLGRPISVSLSHNRLDDRDVYRLANSPHFGRLTCLDLAHNYITGTGALYLARSPYLGSLDDLYLKGNEIPREARAELRRRFGSRVHF